MVMLVLAVTMVNEGTNSSSPAKASPESAAQQTVTSSLPLPLQTRSRLQPQRMTQATLTSHNLTSAYLLGHRSAKKLSTERPTMAHQG
ncbi:hypothetical protein N836_28485 [Leptolyngbya sp. Heron Island J]|nr:hypothetical protein N836_28485 [Leptolyngbya sp. Heron Island J]